MKYFQFLFFIFFSAISFAQQAEYVDFIKAKIDILKIHPEGKEIGGEFTFTFNILKDIDSIYLNERGFNHSSFMLNGTLLDPEYDGKNVIIRNKFKSNTTHKLFGKWLTSPKKAMYFVGWKDEAPNQIWTQGQGKYTSNWLPSIDDTNDKIEFDLSITFDNDYQVISNGKLINMEVGVETTKRQYDMQKPMSSYLVALIIGKYDKKVKFSKSGIPLEMYYYPEDFLKVEPTYRYTKQMFDFLEEEIGVPYPWQNYKQVPVHDFLYAGMENTSCTIFSDAFMVDEIAFVDKNYVNVNAHELAHQWFGNLVTAKSGEHHWLQEGFATYYALLAEREVFGDDYYYWKLYEYAQELLAQDKVGNNTSLLNPNSSSITFYKKGAWVLHKLRSEVGDDAFKTVVKNYLETHQFKNVDTDDFIKEVERASRKDLSEFKNEWLLSKEIPYDEMEENLCSLSNSIKSFLQFDCKKAPEACKILLFQNKSEILNQKIIHQLGSYISKSTFNVKGVKPRQAIAQSLTKIPLDLKEDYESLLNDKSYITIESALYNLWNNFPEQRAKYLSKTKDVVGFNTKNVRLLWLVLALSTPEYQSGKSEEYFNELVSYTSPQYNYELRQNAFQYLLKSNACRSKCYENLKQATAHHNWRLSKFAKEQLKLIDKN